ncbi:RNA-directed DNA polymerase (reverse transcriptase)-related family protein [Euphorbia peplus]|nr:RNA-directed DNA polymerase (reverse transcriptase)-related family protein [Euphorbia peplus]
MLNRFWWKSSGSDSGIHWKNWTRLCVPKNRGGMGFRDIHIFNLALLAKQGWRLLQHPNSLVARVLKAKYYPTSNFLHASLGHNPSYVWRSILNGRAVLERGLRYKVGNGASIDIWDSPWLPDELNPKPTSRVDLTLPTGLVQDLLNQDGRFLNGEVVSEVFNM